MTSDPGAPRCEECGGTIATGGGGLCTSCLLRLGLDDETHGAETVPPKFGIADLAAPTAIGPYRIDRLLGEGGMGRVFLAHQETPIRRSVALKLIKPGIDSRETLTRFEAERRSLELMDHPCIARVLDAGQTDAGQPYFVMEHVDGLPITSYCDEHQLSTVERIRLLVRVCEAVQHAHTKGVIHRDLKPSNILVADSEDGPLPKVIDFGIAKATGERLLEWSHFTEMGRLIGTPEYMSPEQADTSRRDVDTRTDVYALGVILYELLVGRTPHDARSIRQAGLEEMLRQIRETELPTPSSRLSTLGDDAGDVAGERATDPGRLLRLVRGELDWITMRALEKDRERRYGSTRELAADLERFLAHEPVEARAPSAAYRARKFVRRHRLGVGLATAALVTLVAFAGTMSWQAALIARERDRARLAAERAEQVSGLMVELFRSADPYHAEGGDLTAREVLERGVEQVERELADQPLVLARMLAEMGWALAGVGDFERAERLIERSVALYSEKLGRGHEETRRAMGFLATTYSEHGRPDDAARLIDELVRHSEDRLGPAHRETLRLRLEAPRFLTEAGRYQDAIPLLESLLADQAAALGDDDDDTLATRLFLGISLGHTGRREDATPHVDAAVVGLRMPDSGYDEERAGLLMRLGWVCLFLGRDEDSERVYRDVLARREAALGPDHIRTLHTRGMLAAILDQQGRYLEAAAAMEQVLETRRRVLGETHPETLESTSLIGNYLMGAGRYAEAEQAFRSALTGQLAVGQSGFRVAMARFGLARALGRLGRSDEALAEHLEADALCTEELFDRHPICRGNMQDMLPLLRAQGDDVDADEIEARLDALDTDAR